MYTLIILEVPKKINTQLINDKFDYLCWVCIQCSPAIQQNTKRKLTTHMHIIYRSFAKFTGQLALENSTLFIFHSD